jgi:hypothetical protein
VAVVLVPDPRGGCGVVSAQSTEPYRRHPSLPARAAMAHWGLHRPGSPNPSALHRPGHSRDGGRRGHRNTRRRGHLASTARTARRSPRPAVMGFATSGRDKSVVMFDLKDLRNAGATPGCRGRRRDHLRRCVGPRVHLQRRRAFSTVIDRGRAGDTNIAFGGKPEYGVLGGTGRYANLTVRARSSKSTRARPPCCAMPPPVRPAGVDGDRHEHQRCSAVAGAA